MHITLVDQRNLKLFSSVELTFSNIMAESSIFKLGVIPLNMLFNKSCPLNLLNRHPNCLTDHVAISVIVTALEIMNVSVELIPFDWANVGFFQSNTSEWHGPLGMVYNN